MKEYEKAIATYEKGLAFDPQNQELKDGVLRCRQSINKFMMGTATEDEIKERQAKAMSDPEVSITKHRLLQMYSVELQCMWALTGHVA